MSSRFSPPTVAGFRRQATLLLKDLGSTDAARQDAAARRFAALPVYARAGHAPPQAVQRKHALQVIALEQGAQDWPSLKALTEPIETAELLYANGPMSAYWNIWFSNYEEARAVHREKGGFLFPYRNHFFVSDEHFVRAAGLDPDAPEWREIGNDWAKPGNREAWARLANQLRAKAPKPRRSAAKRGTAADSQREATRD